MQIKEVKIGDLLPYENNPRINDGAVEYVANSIKEFGFKVPIVITKDKEIVAGHTRYKAAQRLKMKEVPCIVADDLSPAQIKAFRLADNKVAEFAQWDIEGLNLELDNIDIDMEQFGFSEIDWLADETDGGEAYEEMPDKKGQVITCPHCGGEFEL